MKMKKKKCSPRAGNIVNSFRVLEGNTRISVIFEPLWGIPHALFSFYLSLYMKELGVTDKQLGYLIFLSYLAGTMTSAISGYVTDRLGRKRTTLIFDMLSWPLPVLIYFFSNSFPMFAIAVIINSLCRITSVSWNLMVIEDADNEQRVAAFNLTNIIVIAAGAVVPLAGIMVNNYGVVFSERLFLLFGVISMSAMMIIRNFFYRETSVGKHILEEGKTNPMPFRFKNVAPFSKAKGFFKGKPKALLASLAFILFYVYIPIGTINSLYFAPYLKEVLGLGEFSISILGGIYPAVMLLVLIFITPLISKLNHIRNMQVGMLIHVIALLMLVLIPTANMTAAVISIVIFALSFGIMRPFFDSMMAEVSEGRDRAGIYSLLNTVTCVITALFGFVSGSIYSFNPKCIYFISVALFVLSFLLLEVYYRLDRKAESEAGYRGEPEILPEPQPAESLLMRQITAPAHPDASGQSSQDGFLRQ